MTFPVSESFLLQTWSKVQSLDEEKLSHWFPRWCRQLAVTVKHTLCFWFPKSFFRLSFSPYISPTSHLVDYSLPCTISKHCIACYKKIYLYQPDVKQINPSTRRFCFDIERERWLGKVTRQKVMVRKAVWVCRDGNCSFIALTTSNLKNASRGGGLSHTNRASSVLAGQQKCL